MKPIITGVTDGTSYRSDVILEFDEGTAILTKDNGGQVSFTSGTSISEEGHYSLEVTDEAGNKATVQFIIDKTLPVISGVSHGSFYNENVLPTFNEGTATLMKDGGGQASFVSGAVISEEGHYKLEVIDKVGNAKAISFTIDTTNPKLTLASITSSNSDPKLAKSGDTVTLLVHADEDVAISETKE
ncbi:hypothetical protein [Metabacillus fastidiosus]|uniref:hypothetical protein n=1 Tax=Metabacillus fastidiosus TaxID=1458 RepID=UPI002E221A9B|nr:hypothetical protein [Metabacillus fastidiosus]